MELISKKMKAAEFIFFLAYGMFIVIGILSTSFYYKYYIGILHKLLICFVLLLLIGKELVQGKLWRKSLWSCAICLGLFLLVNMIGAVATATMFIILWTARDLEFERIAKFTLAISIACFVFIICSASLGIIKNYIGVSANGSRVREYLGFRYALFGPTVFFNIVCLYIYVRKARINILETLVLAAINYWVYQKTDSRLCFCLTMALLMVAIVLKFFPHLLENKKLFSVGMICSFCICATISIILTVKYDSSIEWMYRLNSILGDRLRLGKNAITEYGVTLFGQEISMNGWGLDVNGEISELSLTDYNYVDCAYLNMLLRYGIVAFMACLCALTVAMVRCYKRKNYYLLIFLTIIAVHAMIDDLIIYLYYNTLWFVVTASIESGKGNMAKTWYRSQRFSHIHRKIHVENNAIK